MADVTRIDNFKGMRNDIGEKHVETDYFYSLTNFNYDSIVGCDQILLPERIVQPNSSQNDGLIKYEYLDSNNILRATTICVQGGNIYKDWLSLNPVLVKTGLTAGLCSFLVFKDKLFIFNGKNYPQVYWGEKELVYEMGSCAAEVCAVAGNLVGDYYYAVTYITTGGSEEIIGTVSNTITVSDDQALLTIPLPYGGSSSAIAKRRIYRTTGTGTVLKFLAEISNITTLTYTDNIADVSLGDDIAAINNECPKPYFAKTSYDRLVGAVSDLYPTQTWVSDSGIEMFDLANYIDVSNHGGDNSRIMGMETDYAQVIIGTESNWYMLDCSASTVTIAPLRVNVGLKNGYTLKRVPSFSGFDGGVFFVSSLNDARLISGSRNIIPNTINDIQADNFSQVINATFPLDIMSASRFYCEFYDYKYHLIVDDVKYIFDIRKQGWSKYVIQSESYLSQPTTLAVIDGFLYNGQLDGYIEREYAELTYRGENVPAIIESPYLYVSEDYYFFNDFKFWQLLNCDCNVTVTVITDYDVNNKIEVTFDLDGGDFSQIDFNELNFQCNSIGEDLRSLHVTRQVMAIKYIITINSGRYFYRGFRATLQIQDNKEAK